MLDGKRANRLLDFAGASRYNRDLFLLEFGSDYRRMIDLVAHFEDAWKDVGLKRDLDGKSQARLLIMQGIVLRQMVYAFDSLQGSQISQVWLSVRIAIETLLVMGKWVYDPQTADLWANKEKDFRTYKRAFEKELDVKNALPRALCFRGILKAINDEYLHPNPRLVFSRITGGTVPHPEPGMRGIETIWLGQDLAIVETHLLAFVRLFADMVDASHELTATLFVGPSESGLRQLSERDALIRARKRATSEDGRFVLLTLGAWNPTLL